MPELGPAVRELTTRPAPGLLAQKATPSANDARSSFLSAKVSREIRRVRSIDPKLPASRESLVRTLLADYAAYRSAQETILQLKQQTPARLEGDILPLDELRRGISPFLEERYVVSASRVKAALLVLAENAHDTNVFQHLKGLYKASSGQDGELKAVLLESFPFAIDYLRWQKEKLQLAPLREWLKEESIDTANPVELRTAALTSFAANPILGEDFSFFKERYRSNDPAVDEAVRDAIVRNTSAFNKTGRDFLFELAKGTDTRAKGGALGKLKSAYHLGNGSPEAFEAINSFVKQNPPFKEFFSSPIDERASSVSPERQNVHLTASAAEAFRPQFAQAPPPPPPAPGCTLDEGWRIATQGNAAVEAGVSQVIMQNGLRTADPFTWLPPATDDDGVSGTLRNPMFPDTDGPLHVYVYGELFDTFLEPPPPPDRLPPPGAYTIWMGLDNRNIDLGTSLNTPRTGAVRQPGLCLVDADYDPPCAPSAGYTWPDESTFESDPIPPPRIQRPPVRAPRRGRREPVCGNGRVENPPEVCDPPGSVCAAPEGLGICSADCRVCAGKSTPSPPPPPRGPSCGNGVPEPGEQCGEPGLVCSQGSPESWRCVECKCVPRSEPPPSPQPPPSPGQESEVPGTSPGSSGGGLFRRDTAVPFLAQATVPGGSPPGGNPPFSYAAYTRAQCRDAISFPGLDSRVRTITDPEGHRWFARDIAWVCGAYVVSFDMAGNADLWGSIGGGGVSANTRTSAKYLGIPLDTDKDGLPDEWEKRLKRRAGGPPALNLCNAETVPGVRDAMGDSEVTTWEYNPGSVNPAVWYHNDKRDGFSRIEEYRGLVEYFSDDKLINGVRHKIPTRFDRFYQERVTARGLPLSLADGANPEMKELFIVDNTASEFVSSLSLSSFGNILYNSFWKAHGVNAVRLDPLDMGIDPAVTETIGAGLTFNNLAGSVNKYSGGEAGRQFQAPILYRNITPAEKTALAEKEISDFLALTLVNDMLTNPRSGINNFRYVDGVRGLPVLVDNDEWNALARLVRQYGQAEPWRLVAENSERTSLHEAVHKARRIPDPAVSYAGVVTPVLDRVTAQQVLDSQLATLPRNALFIVEEYDAREGGYAYYAGSIIKGESFGTAIENILLVESFKHDALIALPGGFPIIPSTYLVDPRDPGRGVRSGIRLEALVLERIGLPLPVPPPGPLPPGWSPPRVVPPGGRLADVYFRALFQRFPSFKIISSMALPTGFGGWLEESNGSRHAPWSQEQRPATFQMTDLVSPPSFSLPPP